MLSKGRVSTRYSVNSAESTHLIADRSNLEIRIYVQDMGMLTM